MAYHRTAVFKAHDPSGRKLRRVQKMQQRYSSAYSNILWELKGQDDEFYEKLASYSGSQQKYLNRYFQSLIGEQPLQGAMWSGLVEDIQQAIDTYLDTPGANFPAPAGTSAEPIGELLDELLGPVTREEEEELKAEIKRKSEDYARPINFTNYRSNPIIRSEDGEKMWVAPLFQEREDGKTGALPPGAQSIRPDNWEYSEYQGRHLSQKKRECLPIELSQWHMHRFFREGTPKSSKVQVVGGDIYIYYSFAFEEPEGRYEKGNPVMGIDRGEAITAAYSVIGANGTVLENGSSASESLRARLKEIDREIAATQERGEHPGELWGKRSNLLQDALHRISNEIIKVAGRHEAAIVFEDLENLTGPNNPRMKRRQYSRIAEYVQYKAEEEGLWGEVEVHPSGTSQTCAECGNWDPDNRPDRSEFICTECGHEAHADFNAARMIGIRGLWNINGGKSETGCETLSQYTRKLSQSRAKRTEAQKLSSAG